jgi:hypothetical protein
MLYNFAMKHIISAFKKKTLIDKIGSILSRQNNYSNKEKLNRRARFCIFIDYRGHPRKGVAINNAAQVN